MIPPTGNGVLDVSGGAVAAIANYFANQQTNQTNLQIAQEANAAERQIMQEQNAWNLDMWNRQNAYNTPAAQMQRLRDAGINPALAYAQGGLMNESAPAQEAAGANVHTANMQPYYIDPLTMAQIANINAQTEKTKSETRYQDYMNAVEEALANSPIGSVTVTTPDGNSNTVIEYGNMRVEMTKAERDRLNLGNDFGRAEFANLLFNLAVLTGSDTYARDPLSPYSPLPSELPGYEFAKGALRGDQEERKAAGELAAIAREAAKAEKAGRQAYSKWLDEHKDDPVVKFALTLQGFLQTFGISLPRIGGSSSVRESYGRFGTGSSNMSRSWFFGG